MNKLVATKGSRLPEGKTCGPATAASGHLGHQDESRRRHVSQIQKSRSSQHAHLIQPPPLEVAHETSRFGTSPVQLRWFGLLDRLQEGGLEHVLSEAWSPPEAPRQVVACLRRSHRPDTRRIHWYSQARPGRPERQIARRGRGCPSRRPALSRGNRDRSGKVYRPIDLVHPTVMPRSNRLRSCSSDTTRVSLGGCRSTSFPFSGQGCTKYRWPSEIWSMDVHEWPMIARHTKCSRHSAHETELIDPRPAFPTFAIPQR